MENDFYLELSFMPTNFTPASVENAVFFDETNGQVISVAGETRITIQTRNDNKAFCASRHREINYELKPGGPVFAIKCSLTNQFLSVQRSQLSIDIFARENNSTGIRDMVITPSTKSPIHSFYWLRDNKICVLTTKSIEVIQIFADTGKTKCLARHDVTVYWCKYSHATNSMVVSSSPGDNHLHLFTYQNSQLVKLPKLEIPFAIKEKTVWLFKLYGCSYLCHLFCANNEDRLILYNLTKADNKAYVEEAFVILGSPGESYAVNTLDNLIMVHNMNAKSTMLFDIKGVPSEHGPSITGLSQSIKGHAAVIEAAPIKSPSGQTLNVYQAQMSFFQPNLVIDHRNGRLWDIELRLDKLQCLFLNEELALRFSMRRRFNKSVIATLFRSAIVANESQHSSAVPIERLARLLDQITLNIKQAPQFEAVITQHEFAFHILQPLVTDRLIDQRRLAEVILLFLRSCHNQRMKGDDVIIALLLTALVESDQKIMVEQLILNGIIPQTAAVACTLLSNSETIQLGLDMLKRGAGNPSQISQVLLTNGKLIESLKYCGQEGAGDSFSTKKYLDKALANDERLFRIAYRYFEHLNKRAMQNNRPPPMPIPSKYRDTYIDKFGEADLKAYLSLLTLKN